MRALLSCINSIELRNLRRPSSATLLLLLLLCVARKKVKMNSALLAVCGGGSGSGGDGAELLMLPSSLLCRHQFSVRPSPLWLPFAVACSEAAMGAQSPTYMKMKCAERERVRVKDAGIVYVHCIIKKKTQPIDRLV